MDRVRVLAARPAPAARAPPPRPRPAQPPDTAGRSDSGSADRYSAAPSPARRPKTSRSDRELPPSRFEPCMPPDTSPDREQAGHRAPPRCPGPPRPRPSRSAAAGPTSIGSLVMSTSASSLNWWYMDGSRCRISSAGQPGRDVQEHPAVRRPAARLDLGVDRPGHLVPGQQLGRAPVVVRVVVPAVGLLLGLRVLGAEHVGHVVEHEPLALGVAQHAAVAAHRLGDQQPGAPRAARPCASGGTARTPCSAALAPASSASACPSPVYSQELEVTLNVLPMPPVASTTAGASNSTNRPVSRK